MKIMTPVLSAAGTPRQELLLRYVEALGTIGDAISGLQKAMPHPRDYADSDDFEEARGEHEMRLQQLTDIYDEVRRIGEAINRQEDPPTVVHVGRKVA